MAETKKKITTKEVKKTVKKTEVKKAVKKEAKLNPKVWEVPYNEDLVAQVIYVYNNNERKGTANVKDRSLVSGGGKKPWKQKGTGRARAGSIRSSIWVGGGVAFGNVGDRNWNRKINKKMARKATCVMLSERLRTKMLEFFKAEPEKSKTIRDEMKKNKTKRILIVTNSEEFTNKVRNTKNLTVIKAEKVNAKHLVGNKLVYIDNEVINILEKRLTDGK